MKKSLNILFVLVISLFVGIINVDAASFGKITGGNKEGSTFKVTISGGTGLVFTYDTTKVSCGGANTAIYDENGINGRLINNDNVEISCTINVGEYYKLNLLLVDPSENKDSVGTTYEINLSKKPTTTTSSTTTTTKPTTTTVAKSKNANLKSLEVKADDGTVLELLPTFKPDVYEYSITVKPEVKKVNITPALEDAKANAVFSDNVDKELVSGENNKIIITVTAEDGTKKAYTLNIKREAQDADATLKSLFIKECPSFEFIETEYTYNVKINKNVKSLTLDYLASSEKAKVSVSGNEDLEDGSKVKILVTAEDGTKKEYVLKIVKEKITTTTKAKEQTNIVSERNPFVIMILSIVAFGLFGGIIYVIKK